jgi:hypothetical protein
MAITPSKFKSIIHYKCPRCRQGDLYSQPGIWPLKHLMDMPIHCPKCNQKYELETGFYFGTGYVSYALSVAFLIMWFAAYAIVLGITWQDNSIIIALCTGIAAIVVIQPWLMRISRSIYIHMFVKYDAHYS